jgi:radical SAM superfamily enzyme YgiQ (UPF0313 family)
MYEMKCTRPEVEAVCRRQSCVHPTICKLLGTDHGPLVQLMKEAREIPGVRKVLVASGIRMDLARRSPEYMHELTQHHVGGQLKVAPEHVDPDVLNYMRKPSNDDFEKFTEAFQEESRRGGEEAVHCAILHREPSRQRFGRDDPPGAVSQAKRLSPGPGPGLHTRPDGCGHVDVLHGPRPVHQEASFHSQGVRDRKLQRALLQYFKPENYFEVREALLKAGRGDLIGDGCDSLIPSKPPKEAIEGRRRDANARFRGDYVHTIKSAESPSEQKAGSTGSKKRAKNRKQSRHEGTPGYRPGRKNTTRKKPQ